MSPPAPAAGVAAEPIELPRSAGLLYTLGPDHPPVLSVDPGARVRIGTELNIGDVLHDDGDRFEPEMVRPPWLNPATGPIEIRGASAGQVVVCEIEAIEVHSPGLTGLIPGLSPFPDWIREREFGVHANVVPIAGGLIDWPGGPPLPVAPMVGVIGCAPLLESISTVDNGPHGGNLDVQEITAGSRVLIPVAVDGALFALGDCHARQGDGELCGLGAIECRTHTTVRLDLAPRPPEMRWPRVETPTHLCAVACARPLEDAFRLAARELVAWMVADHGFTIPGAVMLLGQVAEARATQIVNPKCTYIVKIAKRWLPPRI
jgi:acetamidase/formamidase